MMGIVNQVQKGQMQRCAQMRAQGDGDCEPSAKRSNAEARADARTGVMGTLNQVQKGQMQRCTQMRMQRCAQR